MARKWMIGTLDDIPLQIVVVDDVTYFLDRQKKIVFLDDKGLPKVEDENIIEAVIAAAE